MKCNVEIRSLLKIYSIPQWRVADALGVHEKTLCVWLRHELPEGRKDQIVDIISKLAKEAKNNEKDKD